MYSFAEEQPVRIDFFGDEVESIRFFDIETQLSDKKTGKVSIVLISVAKQRPEDLNIRT